MGAPIVVTGQETATNADILQASRLQAIPGPGLLMFEVQSDLNVAANNYVMSIQMPDSTIPLNGVAVPAGTVGQLDDRTMLRYSVVVESGHVVFSVVETGTAIFTWRVTYSPF